MKNFNITIMYANGTYSHINNAKGENEKEALKNAINDGFRENNVIVSITILENKNN